MPFLIILNDIRGVELICDALRRTGGIAQSELAAGIEQTVVFIDDVDHEEPEQVERVRLKLTVVN